MANNLRSCSYLQQFIRGFLFLTYLFGLNATLAWSMEGSSKTEVRILAIGGEGVRAIIPLTVLRNIEEQTFGKVNFSDFFDVIEGQASGAKLIVKELSEKKSAKILMNQFRDGNILSAAIAEGDNSANDPTFIAIKLAEEKYPGHPLFIVTLGAGRVPSTDANSPENIKKQSLVGLIKELRGQGREIEHINIDVPISHELAAPTAKKNTDGLRQAGLSLCNFQNPNGFYNDIQKIVKRMSTHKYE